MSDKMSDQMEDSMRYWIKRTKQGGGKPLTIPIVPMTDEKMKPKDHAPKGGVSPRGDLGALSEHERKAMFTKSIKNSGGTLSGTSHLPYRKPATAIDSQFGPGDKVC